MKKTKITHFFLQKNKKKGFAYFQIIFAFYRAFVLMLVVLSIIMITKLFIKVTFDTQKAEMELFKEQLLYSKDGISLYDRETQLLYPGVIDYNLLKNKALFESKLLQGFYFKDKPLVAAKLEFSLPTEIIELTDPTYEIFEPIFYHEDYFKELAVLANTKLIGAGGAKMIKRETPVLIKKIIVENNL